MYWLSLILLLPLSGVLLITLLPADRPQWIRQTALLASAASLAVAWSLLGDFDPTQSGLQFVESLRWNPRLGSSYSLGLDGFSYPMVLLGTLLCFVAILASASIKDKPKGYYLLMLMLESALLGVFMAQDWSLFYVFWELTLIPLFFLIDRWGGENRHGAALNFFLYTMGGSVFMLISLLTVFDLTPGHSFAMADLAREAHELGEHTQVLLFLGLLIGFGVKMPIFPIHGWLPIAHVQAPSPVSILLSGILLKMGAYGLIRASEMLPAAAMILQALLAAIAFVSIIYGGLLAWQQTDLKAMIAYSSVSHMGVVLLGIAALNKSGLTGAIYQMVAHGLVAGALFLLVGLLYERTHTRDIRHYSSLVRSMPRFAFFTSLSLVALIGMPGTAGFIAELHTLIGGFSRWTWVMALLSTGVMITAAYGIRTLGHLFTGPVRPEMVGLPDLRRSEFIAAATLTSGTILLGVYPAPVLGLISAAILQFSQRFAG